MDQNKSGDEKLANLAIVEPLEPALAVRLNCGRRLAIATPISAVAACMLASAARTSGRRPTIEAGRPHGRSAGRGKQKTNKQFAQPPPAQTPRTEKSASQIQS